MELKDRVDIAYKKADLLTKQADILNKKALILIALNGGIITFLIKMDTIKALYVNLLIFLILLVSIGIFSIYIKISNLNSTIFNLYKEIERLENE